MNNWSKLTVYEPQKGPSNLEQIPCWPAFSCRQGCRIWIFLFLAISAVFLTTWKLDHVDPTQALGGKQHPIRSLIHRCLFLTKFLSVKSFVKCFMGAYPLHFLPSRFTIRFGLWARSFPWKPLKSWGINKLYHIWSNTGQHSSHWPKVHYWALKKAQSCFLNCGLICAAANSIQSGCLFPIPTKEGTRERVADSGCTVYKKCSKQRSQHSSFISSSLFNVLFVFITILTFLILLVPNSLTRRTNERLNPSWEWTKQQIGWPKQRMAHQTVCRWSPPPTNLHLAAQTGKMGFSNNKFSQKLEGCNRYCTSSSNSLETRQQKKWGSSY